ncbi:hypothetical protein [Bacillus pretiosus]|uniref:hypothetical protein n=1 Tax=Bacillus pretiosus TaxID=2983392 RepID=UPI003D64BC6C
MKIVGAEEYLKQSALEKIEHLKNLYKAEKNEELDIEIEVHVESKIPDGKYGGFSRFDGEKYSLVLYIDLIYTVDNFLFTLLEGVLPENEAARKGFFNLLLPTEEYSLEKAKIFQMYLRDMCIDIIIYHEFGHILNGHLKYIHFDLKDNESTMHMDSSLNFIEPLESRTLEMDADAFAATRIIARYAHDKSVEQVPLRVVYNKTHAFILNIISAVFVFSLSYNSLGRKRPKADLYEMKYLPPRTRLDHYIQCCINAYENFNKEEPLDEEFKDMDFWREVVGNIEENANIYNRDVFSVGMQEISRDNNLEELQEGNLNHIHDLNNYWSNRLRDTLVKYAYFELAK